MQLHHNGEEVKQEKRKPWMYMHLMIDKSGMNNSRYRGEPSNSKMKWYEEKATLMGESYKESFKLTE